jgi:CRISPR-associated endonuclease/helicase Cas3
MCPIHRKEILDTIRERLEYGAPIICISTQLIEAGVDIDFGSVIRFMAGLDSITQAAGRCNRHKKRKTGNVFIVNPAEEKIDCLKDIAVGKEKCWRVLDDFRENPEKFERDPIGPLLLKWYYQNYFFDRKDIMDYPVSTKEHARKDSLLNLLSSNSASVDEYGRRYGKKPEIFLRQSFMTAGDLFRSIDAPTHSVIVRYGKKGENLVCDLCSAFDVEKQYGLLRKAQQFSVNIFFHEFEKLSEQGAIHPVQEDTEIFYLDKKYYSNKFGISLEPINEEEFLNA